MSHDSQGIQDPNAVYEWGALFASPWPEIVSAMAAKAREAGLVQSVTGQSLAWNKGDTTAVRYVFVDDPSDLDEIRAIYNDEATARAPATFVIVRQPDESETRGDVVFDIFRLSPKSYLWHFHRVYTQVGD